MISKKSAYQLRELLRKCIVLAEDNKAGVGAIRSTKSSLGLSVDVQAGYRTVGTYIGDDYIEMSDKTDERFGEHPDSWGDNSMPSEWWGNGMMPVNPCAVVLNAYEESCFQYEVMCSGTIPEDSMYGLLIRAVLNDLITDGMCVIMQREPFGLKGKKIDPDTVNDLIDDVYFMHFKTSQVDYD